MKKTFLIILALCVVQQSLPAQTLKLADVLDSITRSHPSMKMYEASIRSMDEAAKGARSWEAPRVSTGLWMVPYDPGLWKSNGPGSTGMGQYMISAEQMFPNKKYNDANERYMKAESSVDRVEKTAALNELYAAAKQHYITWIIAQKKLAVLKTDEKLLQFMITNAEIRYKNGLGKIGAYYKAKAALGNLENEQIELENSEAQQRISLNTLMNRGKTAALEIDTDYVVKDYGSEVFDSTLFYRNRSDIKALDKNIQVVYLKQDVERASMKPQIGVRYDHMFGFGGLPMQYSLMGMVKIPLKWSTRSNRANIESLKWKVAALESEKETKANEYSGMAYGVQQDMVAKKRQVMLFEQNIIPALRRNYETTLLAYGENTEELFQLYDAWETLNRTELEHLDQLQELLTMQVELEKIMEVKL
jgi:outer membrane protein TolC